MIENWFLRIYYINHNIFSKKISLDENGHDRKYK